jgi:lysophospholipase L1-like esterase
MLKIAFRSSLLVVALIAGAAHAEQPWTFGNNTRYLSLGDSLAAGYGANPATQGFAYLLYQQGTFDNTTNTLFANAAVPGATSEDVLNYQLPQAVGRHLFQPTVVTLSVGGNDLLAILGGGDPDIIFPSLFKNLQAILTGLCQGLPKARIFIGNLYTIQDFPFSTDALIGAFNKNLQDLVAGLNAHPLLECRNRIRIADVFNAFGGLDGPQNALLLVNRNGAGVLEVHPTNAGYRAMAQAYEAAASKP